MVFLDRHTLNCGGNNYVITMFKLERSGGNIQYKYRCCKFTGNVCSNVGKATGFTDDGKGKTYFLDRQAVACSNPGYLNYFKLGRNSPSNNKVCLRLLC